VITYWWKDDKSKSPSNHKL